MTESEAGTPIRATGTFSWTGKFNDPAWWAVWPTRPSGASVRLASTVSGDAGSETITVDVLVPTGKQPNVVLEGWPQPKNPALVVRTAFC